VRVVHVDIHGQRYAIRSELDPQLVSELATFVDAKMQQTARELATADPLRVAVMAALNLADELYRARTDSAGAEARFLARAVEIERMVDDVLDGTAIRLHA
jgi:cell division protein ZapA